MADAAKNLGGAGRVKPLDFAALDGADVEDEDGDGDDAAVVAARTATVNDDDVLLRLLSVRSITRFCGVEFVAVRAEAAAANRGFGGRPRGAGTLAKSLPGLALTGYCCELMLLLTAVDEDG